MSDTGTAIVDFGAFPGQSEASVLVPAPGISAISLVEAWIFPDNTADHSADEHRLETLSVMVDPLTIVPNVSFIISLVNYARFNEQPGLRGSQGGANGGIGTLVYGKWRVAWVWD
jgi:hypothetical protein